MALVLAETTAEAAPPDRHDRSLLDMAIDAWRAAGSPESVASQVGGYWLGEATCAFLAIVQQPSGEWAGGRHG
jgi:hypothetical protein